MWFVIHWMIDAYFMQSALDKAEIRLGASNGSNAPSEISGSAIEALANDYLALRGTRKRLGKQFPARVLDGFAVLGAPDLEGEAAEQNLAAWLTQLEDWLNAEEGSYGGYEASVVDDLESEHSLVQIRATEHGVSTTYEAPVEFFRSAEYLRCVSLGQHIGGQQPAGTVVRKGDKEHPVESFEAALEWLLDEARRGVNIQRYKGLGEMNPDQLWETTMDPQARRLLQVRIEDMDGANETFSTLMGDEVDPRRVFIERNALDVLNLDA